jgi:hypothetical protein
MKRQRKSGSPAKRKIAKLLARPVTKDSFAKSVEIDADGSRTVHLSPWAVEALEAQRDLFREKFGRDPGPHDPVFFDPDADEPRRLTLDPSQVEADMLTAGARPEVAYAIAKTGVLLQEDNEHLYPDDAKAEFWEAVEEYRARAAKTDA